jgi:hypothetical protein
MGGIWTRSCRILGQAITALAQHMGWIDTGDEIRTYLITFMTPIDLLYFLCPYARAPR